MTDAKPIEGEIEVRQIADLKPHPKDPRTHPDKQVAGIAGAYKEFGVLSVPVVDDKGTILAGHARVDAARQGGITELKVFVVRKWTEKKKIRFMLGDNRWQELGGYNEAVLRENITALGTTDLQSIGYDAAAITRLMATVEVVEEEEHIPEPPKDPITKKGDLWLLGPHRIMCGDCRDNADVSRLMDGRLINVAFTSPPYAEQRNYDEKSGFRPIPPSEYVEWFNPVAANVAAHLASDGSWFINIKPAANGLDTELYVFDLVLAHVRQWGWHFATEYCWERIGVPKSVTRRFKNQYEPIYQFARGDWKMRPKEVMHPSDNVPIPGGPGVGDTSWKDSQGGNGPMFGRDKGRFNARPAGQNGGSPNDEKHQGRWKPNRGLGVGPTNASSLQCQPGAYKRDVQRGKAAPYGGKEDGLYQGGADPQQKKRHKGFPTGEDRQGTNWQEGAPLGIPLDQIVPGMAYPGNRLPTFGASHEATGHAAAFPVGLPGFFVRAYSDAGDAIYDPFLGSGSTVLAADRHGRVGYGMEISAAYVDVCVARWERVTGHKATREKAASSRRRPSGSKSANDQDAIR